MFLIAALTAAVDRHVRSTVTEKAKVQRFSRLVLPMGALSVLMLVGLVYGAVAADPRMTVGMAVAAGTAFLLLGVSTAVTCDDRSRRRVRLQAIGLTVLPVVVFLIRAF